ncbi:MAG: nitroreductase family protein [Bacteroidales bacterium]
MNQKYEVLKQLCETRKSCRNFKSEMFPEESIAKILDIAYKSPYANDRKNWEIITIKDSSVINLISKTVLTSIESISEQIEIEASELFKDYSEIFTFFEKAPVLFIPIFRISPIIKSNLRKNITPELLLWERDNSVKSISCVSMLMLLAAESLGLGACYMTGPLLAGEELGQILNLAQGRLIGALIPVGYCDN